MPGRRTAIRLWVWAGVYWPAAHALHSPLEEGILQSLAMASFAGLGEESASPAAVSAAGSAAGHAGEGNSSVTLATMGVVGDVVSLAAGQQVTAIGRPLLYGYTATELFTNSELRIRTLERPSGQNATGALIDPFIGRVWMGHRFARHQGRFLQILPLLAVGLIGCMKMQGFLRPGKEQDAFWQPPSIPSTRTLEIAAALVLFLVSAPALILLNKRLMKRHHFHFPIMLASLGNVVLMCATRGLVFCRIKKLDGQASDWKQYFRVVLPITLCNFLSQITGMYAYLFMSVPEIQMLKSVTVVMVLCLSAAIVGERITISLAVSIIVIAAGVAVSAASSPHGAHDNGNAGMQLVGLALCLTASLCEAIKCVGSQVLMNKHSLFDGLYWTSPTFVLLACIFVSCLEVHELVHFHFTTDIILLLACNGLLTGVVILSSFWFVKLTGALVLKVTTQARSVGLALCSVWFFGEHCSSEQYVGYTVTILGLGVFDYAKERAAECREDRSG